MAKENMAEKRVNKTSTPRSYKRQVRTIETARWDLVKGDHDRLIEVTV